MPAFVSALAVPLRAPRPTRCPRPSRQPSCIAPPSHPPSRPTPKRARTRAPPHQSSLPDPFLDAAPPSSHQPLLPDPVLDAAPPLPDTAPPAPSATWAYLYPRGLALLVAVLWSSNFAAVKIIGQSMPVADGALARFFLGSLAMAPALLRGPRLLTGRGHDAAIPDGLAFHGLVCGVWISLGYVTQAIALQSIGAGKGAFICSLAVIFVPVVTKVFPKLQSSHKAAPPSAAAALLAVLGVGMMELGGGDFGVAAGDVWALVMMAGFGMGFIENERALEKFPRHATQLTALQLAVVAAASGLWACGAASMQAGGVAFPDILAMISAGGWQLAAAVAYTGLVTTAGTILIENVALLHMTAAEMAVILTTEPLFASAIAAVVLKESMGPEGVAGGALILCACLLNQAEGSGAGDKFKEALGNVLYYIAARSGGKRGE